MTRYCSEQELSQLQLVEFHKTAHDQYTEQLLWAGLTMPLQTCRINLIDINEIIKWIVIVNWEISCWPVGDCFTPADFESVPSRFALVVCFRVALLLIAFCLPPPTRYLVPLRSCVQGSSLSLVIVSTKQSMRQVSSGSWPLGGWLPLYLHYAHVHLLIVCAAHNWHLPLHLNIAHQQVNHNSNSVLTTAKLRLPRRLNYIWTFLCGHDFFI